MANRRTALPDGYYVVEGRDGRLTPYHRTDDMMLAQSPDAPSVIFPPGTLVPIGPSFAYYIEAAKFCYDRAGVPWPHRKRVAKRGTQGTPDTSTGQAAASESRRVLPEVVENASGERQTKRSDRGGGASGASE